MMTIDIAECHSFEPLDGILLTDNSASARAGFGANDPQELPQRDGNALIWFDLPCGVAASPLVGDSTTPTTTVQTTIN